MSDFVLYFDGHWSGDFKDVWPDGDNPPNPTAADVEAVVQTFIEDHGIEALLMEWNLAPLIEVHVAAVPNQRRG